MKLRKRLRELQEIASPLEPDSKSRAAHLTKVAQHAESFMRNLPSRAVYNPPGEKQLSIDAMALSELPSSLDEALTIINEHVDSVGHNLGSSRFFAYIPSGGLYDSALADYLAAVTNRYSGVGHASPGASRMEETLLRWLANVVGYPESSGGDLASGGSIAALSAIMAARESYSIKSDSVSRHVVYLTSHTHHTFQKALHITGLGDCVVREVAVDERFRMSAEALHDTVRADRAGGLKPWLIGASAGATDSGAVDPLDSLADIADEEDLWFHVDAAYGGAFALCEDGRDRLKGLGRSDSLILDPHKGFFLPGGCGAVLVRDGRKLYEAYHARGTYMQDMVHDLDRSACDFSPELTRPFRALRFWLPFKILGTAPFAAALEEKLLLAQYFHDEVSKIPGIRPGPVPDLSIVTFRYVPTSGNADDFNRRLVDSIRDDGRVFLTSTTMDGHVTIRLAVLAYNTHLEAVDTALAVIDEKIRQLAKS